MGTRDSQNSRESVGAHSNDAQNKFASHRQLVITLSAIGVFLLLVAVITVMALISNKDTDDIGSYRYVFSSHTTSEGYSDEDEYTSADDSEESADSEIGSSKKKTSTESKKKKKSSSSDGSGLSSGEKGSTEASEHSSAPETQSEFSSESSHESSEPEQSVPEQSESESSSGGFRPPED